VDVSKSECEKFPGSCEHSNGASGFILPENTRSRQRDLLLSDGGDTYSFPFVSMSSVQ
jgi:hypothetical protein